MSQIKVKVSYLPLSELSKHPHNPRTITDADLQSLCESIKEDPLYFETRPIICSDRTGSLVIIAGEKRFIAAGKLSLEEVPVAIIPNLTEEDELRILFKDNGHFGDWDKAALAQMDIDFSQLSTWGVDIWDEMEKEGWFDTQEAQDDEYDIPDDIKTDIVQGDIFEIGPHRLICGDSTKAETFERLFEGEKADLVITDPPYNVDYEGGTKEKLTIQNDNMSDSDFYQFLFDFYSALALFTKPGGAWYVWHSDSEGANFRSAMKNAGIMVKQCLIWVKNSMVMGRQDYQWKHEPCLYGWKEGAAHDWFSDRKQTTILEFDRPLRNSEHPTMKPVPLIAYQVQNSSRKGAIVADGFGGSGTTMIASHQLDRRCYMAEFDPKYCQVIIDRMLKLDPALVIRKNGEVFCTEVSIN